MRPGQCRALGPGGWGRKVLVSDHLPPLPLSVGSGLCFQHLAEGMTWTKPRGVGRAGQVPLRLGALSIPLSASPQQRPGTDSALRPLASGEGADCRRAIGQLRREDWQGDCLSVWLS